MRAVDNSDGSAGLRWKYGNRDLIPRFEVALRPAFAAENAWTIQFACPAGDLAARVLHVEIQLAMWIAPHEFRHGAVEGYRLRVIVRNVGAVVCEHGTHKEEQT